MAQLLYKTRAGVSPQGKPRVYFTCHEQDHQAYFQQITDEILQISDCAVFYYEPGEVALNEDYYLNLSQIQLMVMPVTSRLLYTPNRAMDVELAYAMEHHIPVLPLMQERNLEEKFNEKFGDLQFLNKYDPDPTAIPYDEKLKKYLQSVLIGDELAARVRAAFDAYIFLSYRKKDRKYAKELMRLLHRDEACRDIAIWYDEFLTPGEDFNESIRTALEKSGLFVLAVTPNLVNETNYIMTTEYPMAKDAGKPILPAEMVATDSDALQANYPDIPDSVDPRDEHALTGVTLKALRLLARRENDNDPKHNFFIGLAYLGGIDVEVNHERAVRLITGAAESGLTEAMEKLISMYENGEGVKRDYHEAIRWRERLTEQARLDYEATGTVGAGYRYLSRLWDLGDAWYALRKLGNAGEVYETMRAVAEAAAAKNETNGTQRYLTVSYSKLGDIARAENDLPVAREWYRKGLQICERLAQSDTPEALRSLSISYDDLGDIAELEYNLSVAREWYCKALQIRERLAQSGTLKSLQDLGISYNKLGDIAEEEGNLSESREWYLKGLQISERLAQNGTPELLRDLSISYNKLGNIAEAENDLSGAGVWYHKGLQISERLAESRTPESLRDLSIIYTQLGNVAKAKGDISGARVWYRKGLQIREELAQSGTPESLRDLGTSYSKLGSVVYAEGDLPGAMEWYSKFLQVNERLAESGTVESYDDLAVSCYKLGILSDDVELLRKAARIYEKLAEDYPGVPRFGQYSQIIEQEIIKRTKWWKQLLHGKRKK